MGDRFIRSAARSSRFLKQWLFPFLLMRLVGLAAIGDVSTHYVNLGTGGMSCCLALDSAGNTFVVGSVVQHAATNPNDSETDISVTKLDRNLEVVYQVTFGGGGRDIPRDMAIDAAG